MTPHPWLRAQRLRDLLAAICEWERASGRDRSRARRHAKAAIREWRILYAIPERAAFEAAAARSKAVQPQSTARERYQQAWRQHREAHR